MRKTSFSLRLFLFKSIIIAQKLDLQQMQKIRERVLKLGLVLLLLLLTPLIHAQSITIKGQIKDQKSGEPLAFVSISSEDRVYTSISDIEGKFTIQIEANVETLVFSYVGYEQKKIVLDNERFLNVSLSATSLNLKTATIVAGENPAHRIIRQTYQNRDKHNPEKLETYACQMYNKLIITGNQDTSSTPIVKSEDLKRKKSADTLFEKQHLFMMESVSERRMKSGKVNEEVTATKVSGLKDASFLLLMMQMQPFGFYEDFVGISGINYLNPISRNSEERYFFSIEDTLFSGKDTTYIISFKPRQGKIFDAMKGLIYISAPDFAIKNVIAEPEKKEATHIKIQQQYQKVNGIWFPEQLNTNINFYSIALPGYNLVGIGKNYVKAVDFNPDLDKVKFSEIVMDVHRDATKKDSIFWENVRLEDLTPQERETFRILDSISKAENFEMKIKMMEGLFKGYIPVSYFNLDLDHLLRYNPYEGFRLGLGVSTNNRFSKTLVLGGHFGYGFKDRAWKYSAFTGFNLNVRRELYLEFRYTNDLTEPGNQGIAGFRKLQPYEKTRMLYLRLFDFTETYEASIAWRWFKYLKHKAFVKQSWVRPMYDYTFLPSNVFDSGNPSGFGITEAGISLRYSYKEKFYRNNDFLISLGAKRPVLWMQTAFGEVDFAGRKYVYNRSELKYEHSKKWRKFGQTSYQLNAGLVFGEVPYSLLINPPGNLGPSRTVRIAGVNTFETMDINEFINDRYASFFIQHDFGTLIDKESFKPSLSFIHKSGIGFLRNPEAHQGINFQTMQHGFHESGIAINNLIGNQFFSYGLGFFYRYGAYHLPQLKDNMAVKLTVGLGF
jgi:hypothetical protein